jgi:hypothetical protein
MRQWRFAQTSLKPLTQCADLYPSPHLRTWRMRKHAKGTFSAPLPQALRLGGEELKLHGFSDANYPTTYPSGCRATSGYVFFLCGGAISSCSRLQPLVTLSTAEVECQALSLADIFTKPNANPQFEKIVSAVMCCSVD